MHLFTLPSVRFLSAFPMHPGRQLQPAFQNIIQLYKNPLSVLCFIILLLSVYREPVPASFVTYFCIQKGHLPKSASVPTIFFKITHLYSIKGIGISSVQTSFPYIMMIWKQWQPADMVKLSDFSPFWLCVPAFQQVCL